MKYPQIIRDKCLADHKSGFQPLYRSAKHLCLSALFIAPRNKNSLIFSHKTSSVFLKKRFGLLKSDRSACEPHRHKLAPARNEEEYNSIEIGAILQYADEQIEVVGKRYGRLLYNSYAEPTGKPVFPT